MREPEERVEGKMEKSEFEKRGGRWRQRWQETQARGAGRGSQVPGGGPCWRRLARCGRRSSHIPPGFPHIRHQSVPKAPAFPAPLPRHWLEKLFFTPSWSLICCGKRKRLLLNEGLRGGRGGGAGDCVSRSCAPTLGWGLPGCRPSQGAGEGGPGRQGQPGRKVQAKLGLPMKVC